MHVRVSGFAFKQSLMKLMDGRSAAVNFSVDNGRLQLQTVDVIIVNKFVDILEIEGEVCSVTVTIEPAIELLSEEYLVDMSIDKDSVEIKQGLFYYIAFKNAEEKVQMRWTKQYENSITESDIVRFVNEIKAVELVNKELGKDSTSVDILNGSAIIKSDNLLYKTKLSMLDMHLSSETLKKLIKNLAGLGAYHVDSERNIMLFKIDNSDGNVAVTYLKSNLAVFSLYEDLIKGMTVAVDNISIEEYSDKMLLICKAYKKTLIEMTVCETGLLFHVNSAKVRFIVGKESKVLFTIKISTAQLNVLLRTFGNEANVQIWRGKDKICIRQKNYNKDLIIAGMIY